MADGEPGDVASGWQLFAARGVLALAGGWLTLAVLIFPDAMPREFREVGFPILVSGIWLVDSAVLLLVALQREVDGRLCIWWELLAPGLFGFALGAAMLASLAGVFGFDGTGGAFLAWTATASVFMTGSGTIVAAIRRRNKIGGAMWLAISGAVSIGQPPCGGDARPATDWSRTKRTHSTSKTIAAELSLGRDHEVGDDLLSRRAVSSAAEA